MASYLNLKHIEQSDEDVEWHPLLPFTPANAKVLFLGSFPPQRKRWCMDFYYPNFINDHWRIEGAVWFGDKDYFVLPPQLPKGKSRRFDFERIVAFCEAKGLAFFDTATAVRRLQDNASDKFLEVVVPTDIPALISQLPELRIIAVTGEKAADTICASLGIATTPKVNCFVESEVKGMNRKVKIYRLPSSSRAYPLAFEKKVEAYRKMFEEAYN